MLAFWGKHKTGQKSAAEWAELAVLSILQVAQKAIVGIQFIGLFGQFPHQVNIKKLSNVGKTCYGQGVY